MPFTHADRAETPMKSATDAAVMEGHTCRKLRQASKQADQAAKKPAKDRHKIKRITGRDTAMEYSTF